MIRLCREPLDREAIAGSVEDPTCGAVATFAGVVRNHNRGREVLKVRYEAYDSMATKKLEQLAEALVRKFGVTKVAIEHRLGDLEVGETSVVMAVSSPHRGDAFDAIREGMDLLKATVPIWKREFYAGGDDTWI